jgi:CRISPR/Cas system-associated exonuclease Cas4 (RecB family)
MADVKKLSASKISTYNNCSMYYFLKYIEHKKIPENSRFTFGKAIHYMLEEFYKKNFKSPESFGGYWKYYWGVKISGDNLKGKQKERLNVEEHPLKNGSVVRIGDHVDLGNYDPVGLFFGYMKLGEGILQDFYRRHIIEKKENTKGRKPPVALEKGFGVRKDEPFSINGHPVQGFIDRVDEKDGKFWIVDYKTDKSEPHPFVLHRNIQFSIYSYAFRKLFETEEEGLLYYHLRTGKPFKTHRSEKDYDYVKRVLDEVAEGITNDRFFPMYGFKCKYCDYQIHCEDYSMDHYGGPKISLEGKIKTAETFDEWDEESSKVWEGIEE